MPQSSEKFADVVGIIPAAGLGTRLGRLPCSKEIYPLRLGESNADGRLHPRVACEFLLEKFRLSGIHRAFLIIRPGKWDIPAYLGDGKKYEVNLSYLMMGHPFGSPFSLDQAWPFVQDNRIALGFPDILFQPDDVYARILTHQEKMGADIVLGLFPTDRPQKTDMVETNAKGQVIKIVIKPQSTGLHYCWVNAVWTPRFSAFLHDHLANVYKQAKATDSLKEMASREFYVGNVIQEWIQSGHSVESVTFAEGKWLDIGTPDDLLRGIEGI